MRVQTIDCVTECEEHSIMKKRVFILSNSKLPHGDANSNYILYMSKALAYAGWDVIAIGSHNGEDRTEVQVDENLICVNIPFQKKKMPMKIKGTLLFGNLIHRELSKWNINSDDYFILYGGYISLFSQIAKKYQCIPKKHIITCVVEWPMASQYKFGKLDPVYLLWHRIFYKWMPYWGKVIVISKNLQRHFDALSCSTFYLPPLIDSEESGLGEVCENGNPVKFIYAGAFSKKDALESMLIALDLLSGEELEKFQFHITNNKPEQIKEYLGKYGYILDKFKNILHIHGWLEYEELMSLYSTADYLLLARPNNQYTISNFPSKVPEMMNYGIVPVCTRVGDYTEDFLTDNVDSIIFDGCEPEDCANAIRRAISKSFEERQQLKNNSKENSKTMFDYRSWSNRLNKFLEV